MAVILDAFSRKLVGWALDRKLAARLPIAALERAFAQPQPPPGLVHHSDRGGSAARVFSLAAGEPGRSQGVKVSLTPEEFTMLIGGIGSRSNQTMGRGIGKKLTK